MSEKCKTCGGTGSVPAEVETAEGPMPCPYVGAPCPDCSPMPEKHIMVRESEWRQMRKALAKCAEGWGNAVEFDLLPRRYHAAATCLRDEALSALSHPTPDGCGREGKHQWGGPERNREVCVNCGATRVLEVPDTKGPYEARFVDGGMPSDCCEYGVISLSEGREVCRVWREQDARAIASALSALAKSEAVP